MGPLHVFQQAVDHGVDGHAVGLGPVAEQDAMAQGGMDQGADVFGLDVKSPPQEGPGLRPQHQATARPADRRPSSPTG